MRRFVTYAMLAASAVLVPTALAGATRNSANFADAAGDAGTAPDFTAVAVTNDDAGRITFGVRFTNRGSFDEDDTAGIVVNTDDDSTTGSDYGFDHLLYVSRSGASVREWTDAGWEDVDPPPAIDFRWNGDGYSVGVDRKDLGNTTRFAFFARSFDNGDEDDGMDDAPDGDRLWRYSLRLPFGLTPVAPAAPLDVGDELPRAASLYTLAVRVRRNDNGEVLHQGAIVCTARVAGAKPLPIAGRRFVPLLVWGISDRTHALCSWNVPAAARGKKLTAKIAVSYLGKTASRTVTAIVR
jgi:hypothetical protein